MNPKVDRLIGRAKSWQAEYGRLRAIALDCGLTEEVKWRWPCYTLEGRNVVLIHGFNEYCALLFFKGALLQDPKGILIQQTKNSQAARQIRFRNVDEIDELEPALKVYIRQAMEVERAGLKVELKDTAEFDVPEEFQRKLDEMPALQMAFAALTPGRQRGYLLYFAGAKQAKTREARIERQLERILEGKGLNDR